MSDKTTTGYEAEPGEVEATVRLLCGDALDEKDWLIRYDALTRIQKIADLAVSAIKRERGNALAEGRKSGMNWTKIAEVTGLGTRQRAQQLGEM